MARFLVEATDAEDDIVDRKVDASDAEAAKEAFLYSWGHFCVEPIKEWKITELGPGDVPVEEIKKAEEEKKKEEKSDPYSRTAYPPKVETAEEIEDRLLREKAAKLKKFKAEEVKKPEPTKWTSAGTGAWNEW